MMNFLLCVLCVGGAVSAVVTMEQRGLQPREPSADMDLFNLAKSEHLWAFLTLTDAVKATPMLSQPGPYTIFVPTDQAIQDYMNPNDQEMLTKNMTLLKQALSYHALDGTLMSSSLQDNQALKTLAGAPLRVNKFTKPDGSTGFTLNGAAIIKSDLAATNGVIHEINQFIFPIPMYDIGTVMTKMPKEYSTVYGLLSKAGMLDTLKGGVYTLFAPTNEALQRVPKSVMTKLSSDMTLLKRVLSYHLLAGARFPASFPHGISGWVKTVEGESVVVMVPGEGPIGPTAPYLMINNCQAMVRQGVTNGVMFDLMCLLLPPGAM